MTPKALPQGTTDLVISSRVADTPDPAATFAGANALERPCAECAAPTWLAPDTVYQGAFPMLLCIPCAAAVYGFEIMPMADAG